MIMRHLLRHDLRCHPQAMRQRRGHAAFRAVGIVDECALRNAPERALSITAARMAHMQAPADGTRWSRAAFRGEPDAQSARQ